MTVRTDTVEPLTDENRWDRLIQKEEGLARSLVALASARSLEPEVTFYALRLAWAVASGYADEWVRDVYVQIALIATERIKWDPDVPGDSYADLQWDAFRGIDIVDICESERES